MMNVLLLVLATATTMLSAGLLFVLFLMPSTSLVPNVVGTGRTAFVVSAAASFVLLVIGCMAGLSIIATTLRPASSIARLIASRIVLVAAATALLYAAAAAASPTHRTLSIWWMDILLVALALTYFLRRWGERGD